MFYANSSKKTETLCCDWSVITICLSKMYV